MKCGEECGRTGKIRRNNGFDIYKEDYWEMTKRIEVEVKVGMKRKRKD